MRKLIFTSALAIGALASTNWTEAADAATVFQGDLAGFNAAAGSPAIAIDFESHSGNIAGSSIAGSTFSSPNSNTLEVVDGNSTFTSAGFLFVSNASTNKLFPTSGSNVLSPGGLALVPGSQVGERDSLSLVFATPLNAFGLDILFQSRDCCSFVSYNVLNQFGVSIASGNVAGGSGLGGQPGGSGFFGVYSDDPNNLIKQLIFTESDGDRNNPDANIGYDTFRFTAPGGIPEPSTWAMMIGGFGLAGAAVRRRARPRLA